MKFEFNHGCDEAEAYSRYEEEFIRVNNGLVVHNSVDVSTRLNNMFYLTPEFFEDNGTDVWYLEELSAFSLETLKPKESLGYHLETSRGYCQGDVAMILYNKNEFGTMSESDICKYFDHVLWDLPVYINVTMIDDEGNSETVYSVSDYLDGYDKQALIDDILSNAWVKLSENDEKELRKYLESVIPEEFSY